MRMNIVFQWLVLLIIPAISFHPRLYIASGADASLSLTGEISDFPNYTSFIKSIRTILSKGTNKVQDLPILNYTAPDKRSFLLADLSDYNRNTVTVAIDKTDVYVVAFLSKNDSFFLKDIPSAANDTLFKKTNRTFLNYPGSYVDLQKYAKQSREDIPLGIYALEQGITNLWRHSNDQTIAQALIVTIQIVSEAARFDYIQQKISGSSSGDFKPSPKFISIQNKWSALSKSIKSATSQKFTTVTLQQEDGKAINITSVQQAKSFTGISLLTNDKTA